MKNRKLKKRIGGLLACVMALGVVMGSSLTAAAEEKEGWNEPAYNGNNEIEAGGFTKGTEESPAQVYLTKNLKMAEGMNTPEGIFVFHFDKIEVDGEKSDEAKGTMPEIEDKMIAYSAADTADADNGLIKVKKKTEKDILEGLVFPHAGEYVYSVTEVNDYRNYNFKVMESMDWTKETYEMTVIAANKEDGSGTYVKYAAVKKVTDISGNPCNEKVNPSEDLKENTFMFNNVFRRIGNTEPNEDSQYPNDGEVDGDYPEKHNALTISKTVTGDGDKTKAFDFEITLHKSATELSEVTQYAAYKYKGETPVGDGPIMVTVETSTAFQLKDGERLVFPLLPTGTKYDLKETQDTQYTSSLITKSDGGENVAESAISVEQKLVGDEENFAAYTNDRTIPAPTGILIHNLPFILMISAAVGALVIFIISKNRKRKL